MGTQFMDQALATDGDANHAYAEEFVRIRTDLYAEIRTLVLEQGRIDILAQFVLGYDPRPFHREMMEWQSSHQEGLLLAWRGSGKTTYCTITRCIFEIIRNPNVRILLASDAVAQGQTFLRAIKSHLKHDEKFRAIFGDYVTGARTWTESEITVNRRTSHAGEPTIMCVGVGTTLPSRHFDIIICDDLVTEGNSSTEVQRSKIHNYFYGTLFPTLESPHGKLWVLGTRWDEEDLYQWLQNEDYKNSTLIIGVLDENDVSRWEEKFPTERMYRRRKANLNAFELQYMCRSGVGVGGIFVDDHFIYDDDTPNDVFKWQGVDLAIGQKDVNDYFAHSTIAVQKGTKIPYLLAYRMLKIPFPRQLVFIKDRYEEYPDVVRVIVEANAFQLALIQQMRVDYPDVPVIGRYTLKDKVARAQQVALTLTDRPLRVKRGHHEFVRLLKGFPNIHGSKDLFDSFEIALSQGLRGGKKTRKSEPGLI